MEKQDSPDSQRKTSFVRPRSIVAVLLIASLVIGSWVVVSQMARQQLLPAGERAAVPNETSRDVYIAYKDVVYKLSGRDGSVIWKFALKQAYKPDRIIGSYLQLDVINDVVYAALEYGIYALRGSDGKQLWHYAPKLTPAELAQDRGRIGEIFIDKSLMYVQLARGDMAALDLRDGKLQWSHLSFPNGGSFSPADDTLYASEFSLKGVPMLQAIDGRTGKERWHFERQLINTSLSPTFIFDGIVYSSGNPLYALDARTGKELWEQRLPAGPVYFDSLQLRNGVLYVNTGAAIALPGGQAIPLDYFRVFAFDPQTGKQLWESKSGYSFRDEVIDGGKSILVETVAQKGYRLQALDAKTGTLRWQISLGVLACDIPGSCSPQLAASDSYLYVLTGKRPYTLQVFDAHTGKPLGQHPIAIPVKEGLDLSVLSNDVLYVRSSVHEGDPYTSGSNTSFTHYFIYAIRLADGAPNWKDAIGPLLDVQVPITELLLAP
ncbi:MAG TPA: PQQ-binding-like beta-propeller repeat protein [Ktedonobacteraceae bacterium]|nr:PQQ-binding-like beta-propeller repeat protein [Ktedonobacteraceae bacterium]